MAESEKDQKTEEATPRRREQAREEGQVAMSQEFVSALMMAAGMLGVILFGQDVFGTLGAVVSGMARSVGGLGTQVMTIPDVTALMRASVITAAEMLAVLFLPVLAVGLVVGYGQVGFQIAPKAVAPDPSKLDPIKGFQRLFSARSWMRTGLSALKIVAIAASMVVVAVLHLPEIARVGESELGPLLAAVGTIVLRSGLAGLLAMFLLSIIDLLFQRWQHEKDLRMTKEEVKEDHKTTEGDPHVKARVRALQREAAQRRMMDEVPNATVVVTNPDHFAVALAYPRGADGEPLHAAPRVVAKGMDHLAQRIKKVARDNGVLLYEDVPLARALYARVEIGQEIPDDFYAAVAAVLNYVYGLKGDSVAV